ncbi:TPA: hypothetical protein ACX6SH_004203 [Photobacterium damselae]|uniref:hypothetical protein n=1 Tax=Photobacterium leiognathi TaxID=553611 RepID=UPI0027390D1F|nr:hypothetical protein [Photobacterium leiognathi]
MSNKERAAQRALDIINNLGGVASEFRDNWLIVQAYSTEFEGGDQRAALIAAIEESIDNQKATEILGSLQSEVQYLQQSPVGDLRFESADVRFRRNGLRDITNVVDEQLDSNTRLANLICVVYQIRCNIDHGHKILTTARSQRLFTIGNSILSTVVGALMSSTEDA